MIGHGNYSRNSRKSSVHWYLFKRKILFAIPSAINTFRPCTAKVKTFTGRAKISSLLTWNNEESANSSNAIFTAANLSLRVKNHRSSRRNFVSLSFLANDGKKGQVEGNILKKTIFKNYWNNMISKIIVAGQERGKDFALEQLFSLNGFSLLTFDLPLSAYNSCPRWTCPKFHRSRWLIWIHFHLALFQKRIVQPRLDESDGDFSWSLREGGFFFSSVTRRNCFDPLFNNSSGKDQWVFFFFKIFAIARSMILR